METHDEFFVKSADLVLGLVAPVGTDFDTFMKDLRNAIKPYDYGINEVRISDLADGIDAPCVQPDVTQRSQHAALHAPRPERSMYGHRLRCVFDQV